MEELVTTDFVFLFKKKNNNSATVLREHFEDSKNLFIPLVLQFYAN